MTRIGFDTVTTGTFQPWMNNPAYVLSGYADGRYMDIGAIIAGWPNAKHFSYAVFPGDRADCLDVEPGDAIPSDCPTWFARWRPGGNLPKPAFYCSSSKTQAVVDVLAGAGISRDRYLIQSAHYSGVAHICGPNTCGYPPANATQWTDVALGGLNLDESLFDDSWFPLAPPPPPPQGEIMAVALTTDDNGQVHCVQELSNGEVHHIRQLGPDGNWDTRSHLLLVNGKVPAAGSEPVVSALADVTG